MSLCPRLGRAAARTQCRADDLGAEVVLLGLGDTPKALPVDEQPALDRLRPEPTGELQPRQLDDRVLVLANTVGRAGPESTGGPAHGEQHLDVADALIALSVLDQNEGDFAAAERRQRRALDIQRALLPATDVRIGDTLTDLSVTLLSLARYAEAETKLQQVRSAYSSAEGFKHLQDQIRLHQALLLVERKQLEEARQLLHLIPDAQQSVLLRHMVWRTKARVEAVLGDAAQARTKVGALVAEARAAGDVLLELEDRIVLGEIALDSGDVAAGRTELADVARRARSFGLLVIAERAQRGASR